MSDQPHKLDIAKSLVKGITIHASLQQEVIATTADKMRLCLHKTLGNAEARSQWIAPAGIGLSILATLTSAEFKDFGWISKDTLSGGFLLVLGAVGLWLFVAARNSYHAWQAPSPTGDRIEDIVEAMRAATPLILEGPPDRTASDN